MTIKTFYKVNNLEFANLKDAETFDSYLKSFNNYIHVVHLIGYENPITSMKPLH